MLFITHDLNVAARFATGSRDALGEIVEIRRPRTC